MESLDMLFRKRIGFREDGPITFEDLPALLTATCLALPFENLVIIEGRGLPISRENLMTKMLVNHEGGLCYELNPLLYFFLLDNGFDVTMLRGTVYSPELGRFATTGDSHVTLLMQHEGNSYLVDTGFGGFLPLAPVPLDGKPVESMNGKFRVLPATGESAEHGDFVYELMQRYKDEDFRLGFAFNSRLAITIEDCEQIRQVIVDHPASIFNKRPLVTKLTERGNVTLTDTSLTITEEERVIKEDVDPERFRKLLAQHFGIE